MNWKFLKNLFILSIFIVYFYMNFVGIDKFSADTFCLHDEILLVFRNFLQLFVTFSFYQHFYLKSKRKGYQFFSNKVAPVICPLTFREAVSFFC